MPGWDGYPIRERFAARYRAPVWVDNDVNVLALGEWRSGVAAGHDDVVVVKIGTGIGSALALLAYLAWPTWERGRVHEALAEMLDTYRRYFLAVLDGSPRVRDDIRRATRGARTNAQASLDRLRSEPRRNPRMVAIAEGIFANANRFLRAAMTLEAVRQNSAVAPAPATVGAFVERVGADLSGLAQSLRDGSPAAHVGTALRAEQRALAAVLGANVATDEERILAAAWIDASDRITDSVNTLEHLQRNTQPLLVP